MAREHRRQLVGSAMVCSVMANLKRDKRKRSKPFMPEDFLPPDPDEKLEEQPEQTPEQMLGMFQFLFGSQQKQITEPKE